MIIFNKQDSLNNVVKSIPDKHGIYILYNPKGEIIYIGKAGSIKSDGSITKQTIRKRLLAPRSKYNNIKGDMYFKQKMEEYGYEYIMIDWEVSNEHCPAYDEAYKIEQFRLKYHRLPIWNNSF